MMADWTPDYLCILSDGCDGVEPGAHSLDCKKKNKEYVQAARKRERERRIKHMDTVIRGEDPTGGWTIGKTLNDG